MKQYGAVLLAFSASVLTAAAYSGPNPNVYIDDPNIAAVDEAVRRQSAAFLNYIYAVVGQPQPDGSSEIVEELIAASLPEPLRQEVANELEARGDGVLSGELKERINQHILEWCLQYIPEDLQKDITAVLEEYKATGQVLSNTDELTERIQQYIASLESGRNKRGFGNGVVKAAVKYCVDWLFSQW